MDQKQFTKVLNNVQDWKTTELEIRYTKVTPDFFA